MSRRVQLAVVAHIRHVYTDYDKLLKTGTFKNARAAIEKPCLDILAQWRSDDDDDPNAMEEILREVIVIDDDDEENKDNEIPFETHESVNRDDSIEIISSHVLPEEVQMHQSDYGGPTQRIRGDRSYNPGVEDRETLRYTNPEQLRSNHHSRSNLPPLDRSGVHHHRWQEALHRQRANPLFIHSDKHDELVQRLEISPRAPTFYTEAEPRQLRLEHQARELLPLEKATYNQHQNLPYLDIKGNENPAKEGLDFPNGNLHPDPLRLREVSTLYLTVWIPKIPFLHIKVTRLHIVGRTKPQQVVIPAEAHMSNNGQNNGQRLVEPRSSQRIRRNSNDYVQYGQPGDPRLTTSEEEITHVRDKIPRRVLIDATHNPQPRHPLHQNPGERLRSAEGKIFGTNNVENPFKVSNERSPNYLDESHRFDRRIDFGSRNIHVNDDIETHNRKRRRVEELAPISSERFRQHQDHPHPQRTVLIPLHTDDGWSDSHQQLSPSVQLSTVNPFIRRHPDVYARPVNAMRNADREMLPHSRQHEASGAGREPVRDFGSAENFHPSSHSVRNVPAVPQQIQQDSLYSAFEAPRKVSSIPSFRDDHIRLQSSYIPFNSSKSSRHDYDHSTSGFPSRGHIDTVEHRAADQRRHEQELPSNFARLATRSRYDSGHSKSTHDGFETHRATLVPTEWDRALTPLRGEARTGVFLRKLPDESRMIRDDARLRTSRSRLLHKENISPRSDANNLMPFDAGTRDPQTWTPVRGQAETNLWQSTSKLADDQRYVHVVNTLHDSIPTSYILTSPILGMTPESNGCIMLKLVHPHLRNQESSSVGLLAAVVRDMLMCLDGNQGSLVRSS